MRALHARGDKNFVALLTNPFATAPRAKLLRFSIYLTLSPIPMSRANLYMSCAKAKIILKFYSQACVF
jgi:hypothetical protein